MKKTLLFPIIPWMLAIILSAFIPAAGIYWPVIFSIDEPRAQARFIPVVDPSGPRLRPLLATVDISVVKSSTPAQVYVGDLITYTITVTNNDPSVSSGNITVTDILPDSNLILTYRPSNCSYVPGQRRVTCTRPPIGPGGSDQVTLVVDTDFTPPGTITNNVDVVNQDGDIDSSNNHAQATTTVVNVTADLAIGKRDAPDPVIAGHVLTYTLAITNAGPDAAVGVLVTDPIPAQVTYLSSNGCTLNASTLNCPVAGGLPVGASQAFTYSVLVAPSAVGVLSNQAYVTSTSSDPDQTNDQSLVVDTTVQAVADLSINKSAPAQVIAGDLLTYNFTVTNHGPSDAASVVISDSLPPGTSYSSSSVPCSQAQPGDPYTCNLGTLAPGASQQATLTVLVSPTATSGTLNNQASVTSSATDPDLSNNVSQTNTTITTQADLSISKTAAPTTAVAGRPLTYTLSIANAGPSYAANVVVVDTLPPNVTYTGFNAAMFICNDPGTGVVTCDATGSLPAGTHTIELYVAVASTATGSLQNDATATGSTPDPTLPNQASLTTPVSTSADLAMIKTGLPSALRKGDPLVYTLLVTNHGPSVAQGVTVNDPLPPHVIFQSIVTSHGTCQGGANISCALGALASGDTATIVINVQVQDNPPPGDIINTAGVTSTTPDPAPGSNQDTETTQVSDKLIDLQVTAIDSPDPATAGMPLSYQINVSNAGPSSASSVVLTSQLPSGVTFVSSTPGSPTCTHTSGVVTCNLGGIQAGVPPLSITISGNISSAATGTLSNLVTATAAEADQDTTNNNVSASTQIQVNADLEVLNFSVTPNPVVAGNDLNYYVNVRNNGPSDAVNTKLSFTLPTGLSYLNSGTTPCTLLGNILTCTVGPQGRLIPQATQQASINFHVSPAMTTNPFNASVTVSSDGPDPITLGNTSTAPVYLQILADLQLTMVASPSPVLAGGTLTYNLQVTNNGPSNAAAFSLVDTLPAGVSIVSFQPANCTLTNNQVTCSLTGLAPAASHTVTIVVGVGPSMTGSLVNQALVQPSTYDWPPSNNSAATTTLIDTQPPSVTWTSPGPGSAYYQAGAVVHLAVNAQDDLGVDRVIFVYYDTSLDSWVEFATDTTAPYTWNLDTGMLPTGWREIAVKVYDLAGRYSGEFGTHWIYLFISRFILLPFLH